MYVKNCNSCEDKTANESSKNNTFVYSKITNVSTYNTDECGGKIVDNNAKILFNIDAPVFIPGNKVHTLLNIYAQVFTGENISKQSGLCINNAGHCLYKKRNGLMIKNNEPGVNDLHKDLSSNPY